MAAHATDGEHRRRSRRRMAASATPGWQRASGGRRLRRTQAETRLRRRHPAGDRDAVRRQVQGGRRACSSWWSPLGIGRLYMGGTNIGIAQLLVTLVTCGIGALWPFIDGDPDPRQRQRDATRSGARCAQLSVTRRSGRGHEVDQLLDPAEQGRVEVLERRHPGQDVLPGAGDVGLVAVRPAELLAGAGLPVDAAGHVRPALECRGAAGFTACQMSMNGCPTISTCLPTGRPGDALGDPALLGALDQVVDEHADPALRARA